MTLGLPAYYLAERELVGSRQNARSAAMHAFEVLGWRHEMTDVNTFRVTFPPNVFSWGETLTVWMDEGSVRIKSICNFPTQVFDWGKNKRNVTQFLTHFAPAEFRNHKLETTPDFLDESGATPLERVFSDRDIDK
jgi:hypothetical protein